MKKQLTQFKCYHFEEWQEQESYIPLAGEICGFIIWNDEELESLVEKDLIPNGYEGQNTPYTLMKMGDGVTPIMDLPWAGLTDEKVVSQLIDNLFQTEDENFINKIGKEINKYIVASTANWDQNNAQASDYIKNRICYADYEKVPENSQVLLLNQVINMQYNSNIQYYEGSITVAGDIVFNFRELDKFQIDLFNPGLSTKESFVDTAQFLGLVQAENILYTVLGLGNTALFNNWFKENNFNFLGKASNDPYAYVIFSGINPETKNPQYLINIIASKDYIITDTFDNKTVCFDVKWLEKCLNINHIDLKWLPQTIKSGSDWNANSYQDLGYIKNRICYVSAYADDYKNYLFNHLCVLDKGNQNNLITQNSNFTLSINDIDINTLNKYQLILKSNLEETGQIIINDSFQILQSSDTESIYLLGNKYLFAKWLYDSFLETDTMPEEVINFLNNFEDTGKDYCLFGTLNEDILYGSLIYRNTADPIYNSFNLSYKFPEEGLVTLNNDSSITIKYNYDISTSIEENTKNFLDNSSDYYLIIKINDIYKPYLILASGNNYLTIQNNEEELNSLDGTSISTTIVKAEGIKYLTLQRTQIPSIIKQIDPIWIPEELKIGQYENALSQEISAEIFNDYTYNHAYGAYSHAEGHGTIANGEYQHVQGRFNQPTSDTDSTIAFIIGNGNSDTERSNSYVVGFDGNSVQSGIATAKDFATNGHLLSQKENSVNKVNKITESNSSDSFPTSQAVIDYFNSIFFSEVDDQGNITLNIGSIDGNGLYGNPFIDEQQLTI